MYDLLVEAGRYDHICQSLLDEFGVPEAMQESEEAVEEAVEEVAEEEAEEEGE